MSEQDKKNKKTDFTEEQVKNLNQKLSENGEPEFDVMGTLESLEAYTHFMDQCPEDRKEEVLEDIKQKTDAWQQVFDGFKKALKDPVAKEHLRKLIIENWKK